MKSIINKIFLLFVLIMPIVARADVVSPGNDVVFDNAVSTIVIVSFILFCITCVVLFIKKYGIRKTGK